jgi:hypothetical protein
MATFTGTDSNNRIVGSNSPDLIDGRGGNDLIFGYGTGSGVGGVAPQVDPAGGGSLDHDKLLGGLGHDTIHAGGGNDTLDGASGHDVLNGGDGNDAASGGSGNDTLDGRNGRDMLNGDDGNDTVSGGSGNDTLAGGIGNDTYRVSGTGHGFDRYQDAGGVSDRITATADGTRIGLLTGFGPESGIETITANGFNGVFIVGQNGADTFNFGSTSLVGIGRIDVGGGSDTVTGSSSADSVLGGAGNDSLDGAQGADTLTGGAGNDRLTGGPDLDTAVFAGNAADYEISTVGGVTTVQDLQSTVNGNDGKDSLIGVERLQFRDQVISPPPEDSNFRQVLTAAPENEWIRVNLNHFQDVWTPKAQRAGSGNWEPDAVIGAWGSMAWDSKRGDLICWGGGHANYNGNEVYVWHSSTLEWERASLPSEIEYLGDARYEAIDGYLNAPISSHTYDNSEYLPIIDRFVVFGGAAWNTGGSFVRTDGVTKTGPYFWDPAKADGNAVGGTTGSQVKPELFPDVVGGEMWENRDNLSLSGMMKSFVMGTTAYAQENGKDVLYIGRTDLWKYTVNDVNDPASDTFQKVGASFVSISSDGAGAISTDLNVYLRTTKSKFVMWDLDHAGPGNKNVSFVPDDPTGTFDFARLADYGMDYDPVRGVFILWKGDAEVWTLTPPDQVSTAGWRLTPLTPDAVTEAPDTSTVGVFGKWKYAAEQDIFIGVNDGRNGDVWVYKPHDWNPSNSLPELTFANTSILARHSSSQTRLTDLIDWSDADGDALSFCFTDLNPNATSGYFLLGGNVQNAGQEIAVSAKQLVLGDLLWVNGDSDQSDDITIQVSDPFGSAPVCTIRLPGDPGDPSPSFINSNSEGLSDANLADLISASA